MANSAANPAAKSVAKSVAEVRGGRLAMYAAMFLFRSPKLQCDTVFFLSCDGVATSTAARHIRCHRPTDSPTALATRNERKRKTYNLSGSRFPFKRKRQRRRASGAGSAALS